jgi:DNA-binding LytR/AlgR family response regulator
MENINYIFIKINKTFKKVLLEDIVVIKANGDYCTIQTKASRHTVLSTMSNIESKLSKELFIRIHKSTIIPLKEIVSIDADFVHFNSNEWYKVSDSKMKELKSRLIII